MPSEFWRLTPAELSDMLGGAAWRDERQMSMAAWITSHLMNMSGKTLKRTVTANELLGKRREVVVRDPVADMETLWAKAQKQRAAEGDDDDAGEGRGP